MHIQSFFLGPMDNIIYIISDPKTKTCLVIDPAWDAPQLINYIEKNQLHLNSILLTHGHHDHCNGLNEMLKYHHMNVYLSEQEAPTLTPNITSLIKIKHNDQITVGELTLTSHLTPGHTPGGICYYIDTHLFTGDTLFIDGCGRCDLDNSNVEDMYHSLEWIKSLPPNTILYPGHHYGNTATDSLKNQKKTNRFLTCQNKQEFIRKRMGTS